MKTVADFDNIILTKNESELLLKIQKKPGIEFPLDTVSELYSLGLITSAASEKDLFNAPVIDNTWKISKDGERYFRYLEMKNMALSRSNSHDWAVAIFSALAGALASAPVWSGIRVAASFVVNHLGP